MADVCTDVPAEPKKFKALLQIMENEYKTKGLATARINVPNSNVGTNETYIPRINLPNYGLPTKFLTSWDSTVSIATHSGPDSPGIKSWCG